MAEQALSVSLNTAEAAEAKIKDSEMVAFLCEDCETVTCTQEPLKGLGVALIDDGEYNLVVNGRKVDLAYVYFYSNAIWTNVASSIKYPIEEVPETMPHNQCSGI